MFAKITSVTDIGVLDKERIVIKALNNIDIGRYSIFKTGVNITGGKKVINNKIYVAYWFPDKLISTGDFVVLYTKAGITSEVKNVDGSTTHFFYWGLTTTIWEGTNSTVLVSVPEWQSVI